MSLDLEALDNSIRASLYNPQNIFRDSLLAFQDASEGTLVPVDGTTPFTQMMMYIATTAAISNDQIERAARREIPEYANSISELVPHLDYDTLQTIYATPSTTKVNLVLPVEEMMSAAITGTDGVKYLIIPADTTFTYIDGTVFSLYHSVMIRILDSDTMDIYYLENNNPLKSIDTPVIGYTKTFKHDSAFNVTEMISIPLDVYQFSTTTEYRGVTISSGFQEDFIITDQLYHVRIFTTVNGQTVELLTAHGDFKYNPNSDTAIAVLQYLDDNTFRIKIPDVFIEQGLVGQEITIRILETKGDYEMDMANDGTFNMVPEFNNSDASISNGVNAIRNILNLGAFSATDPAGGVDMPTLAQLRARIIAGNTDNDALTEEQLEVDLGDIGYSLSHELNYIGNNVFVTTCKVDDYTDGDIPTNLGAANTMIELNGITDKAGVLNPQEGCAVITPMAVMDVSGTPEFMTYEALESMRGLDQTSLLTKLNNENIQVPIFYYLLDTRTATPKFAAIDLDNPTITVPNYMSSNLNNGIKVATSEIAINKVDGSYFVHVLTTGNDACKELGDHHLMAQLTTKDEYESVFSINSELTSRDSEGNFLFRFELQTDFDLGIDGTINILNFENSIYDNFALNLESLFYINYVVTDPNYVGDDSSLEDNINSLELATQFSVVTVEETTITIGSLLDGLFTPIKSLPSNPTYQTHTEDVLKYWEDDVYETDENGMRVFYDNEDFDPDAELSATNQPLFDNKIHSAGDPVLDSYGKQEYEARAGDFVLDANGEKIVLNAGDFDHQVMIQGMDYKFHVMGKLSDVQQEVKHNLTNDIAPLANKMIQDTELKYTLSNTAGTMEVTKDGGGTTTISNEITMTVIVKVDEPTYRDSSLRKNIISRIKSEVSKHIATNAYIENELSEAIQASIGNTVVSFKITDVSSLGNAQSFQLVNSSDNMGIKSVLTINDAGDYEITDGIEVNFIM